MDETLSPDGGRGFDEEEFWTSAGFGVLGWCFSLPSFVLALSTPLIKGGTPFSGFAPRQMWCARRTDQEEDVRILSAASWVRRQDAQGCAM